LRGDPSAGEVTGQAWWRLGQLQAAQGDRDPSQRAATGREAETSYERALALAPNEETYLLAAGYQSLANGDRAAATRWYTRAAEVVPNSADAFAGLAWTAALAGDCAHARANADRARMLRAQQGSTVRDPREDPVGGPALTRCST
jgi:Flp pilus assembly protein TadD